MGGGKEGECVCGMLLNPRRRQRHHCLSGHVCAGRLPSLCALCVNVFVLAGGGGL